MGHRQENDSPESHEAKLTAHLQNPRYSAGFVVVAPVAIGSGGARGQAEVKHFAKSNVRTSEPASAQTDTHVLRYYGLFSHQGASGPSQTASRRIVLRFGSVVLVSGDHVRAVAIAVRVGTVLAAGGHPSCWPPRGAETQGARARRQRRRSRLDRLSPSTRLGVPSSHRELIALRVPRRGSWPRRCAASTKRPAATPCVRAFGVVQRPRPCGGYSVAAAQVVGEQAVGGRLTPGRRADLTVVMADPALVLAAELPELPVQLTTVGGRGMHDDGSIR